MAIADHVVLEGAGSAYARNLEREFAEAVLDRLDLDLVDVHDLETEVVNEIIAASLDEITARLIQKRSVTLRGFGVFEPRPVAPTIRFKPGTSERFLVPAKIRPVFRASKVFKQRINGGYPVLPTGSE